MQSQAADEFAQRQVHSLVPCTVGVVFIVEGDGLLLGVQGEQAAVADADSVGVAREISQHLLGAGEGAFAVNDPVLTCRGAHQCLERRRLGQGR